MFASPENNLWYDVQKNLDPESDWILVLKSRKYSNNQKSEEKEDKEEKEEEVDGILVYSIKEYRETMKIKTFLYKDIKSKYWLLGWIGRHEGQVNEVVMAYGVESRFTLWGEEMATLATLNVLEPALSRIHNLEALSGLDLRKLQEEDEDEEQQNKNKKNLKIQIWVTGENLIKKDEKQKYEFQRENGILKIRKLEECDDHKNNEKYSFLTWKGVAALFFIGINYKGEISASNWGKVTKQEEQILRTLFPAVALAYTGQRF